WEFGEGPPTITRYWSPPDENVNATPPSSEELEELLDRAIARQMISDVPVGAFLSGGIDSSLLVALMVRHSAKPVRTFSCAFAESAVNESPIAELVARQFQTDHVVLQAEEIGGNALLSLFSTLDEPLADPALIPTY
ncbi:MAG: asparagine synthase C-terminal domain-containing protein, partial [Nitrospira sp.]|nr:asparagine synthase C-terminal domain-containing protein [Nitrospira sp.]